MGIQVSKLLGLCFAVALKWAIIFFFFSVPDARSCVSVPACLLESVYGKAKCRQGAWEQSLWRTNRGLEYSSGVGCLPAWAISEREESKQERKEGRRKEKGKENRREKELVGMMGTREASANCFENSLAFTVSQTTSWHPVILLRPTHFIFSVVIVRFNAIIKLPLKRCCSPLYHSDSSAGS